MNTIKDVFGYPFRGAGWTMMVLGTGVVLLFLVAALLPLSGRSLISSRGGSLIVGGYLAVLYLDVIFLTVAGGNEMPDWPTMDDDWEDFILPLVRLLGAMSIAAVPVVSVIYFRSGDLMIDQSLLFFAMIIGVLYLPMALLNAAVHQTMVSLLPHRVLPEIWRCMPFYLLSTLLLIMVSLVWVFTDELLAALSYSGWVIAAFSLHYLLVVFARSVGIIYRFGKEKLDV